MDAAIKIICPDLSLRLGFCSDCYQKNVRVIWPYLTCYCDCNRVGAYAEIIGGKDTGADDLRVGSWKLQMEVSREDFERNLPKGSNEKDIPLDILFKT
jgi:hypothetical protein